MPRNPLFLSWKKLLCRAQCLILDIFFLLSKRYLVNYPCFKSKTLLTKLCRSIYVLTTIPLANVNKYSSACNGFVLNRQTVIPKKDVLWDDNTYLEGILLQRSKCFGSKWGKKLSKMKTVFDADGPIRRHKPARVSELEECQPFHNSLNFYFCCWHVSQISGFVFQKAESVWIVLQRPLLYGEEMEMDTTSVMPVVYTTKWMVPIGP